MQKTFFHSDDYGMSVQSSKYILSCCDEGVLSSVAVMPNSPVFADCCQMLKPYVEQGRIAISVHLNLVEGKALSTPDKLPLLTDEEGFFCCSFEKLFLMTLSAKRSRLRREIKRELVCQIRRVQEAFPAAELALDSHQHFHMIPLVFDTILDIIKEMSLSPRYVRLSCEPVLPFLLNPSVFVKIRPVNMVKNLLLNLFGCWDKPALRRRGIPANLFWGLMFSGNMNLFVVDELLPVFEKTAARRGLPLEILSHPCPIEDTQECLDKRKKEFVDFYFSRGRFEEAAMLKSIGR